VPVFPLPGIVLFPGTTLPLHVFELRYRTMVRDALSGGRQLALALLKPGWELDYYGSPEFHDLGCLARFDEVEWLPNDCYDLRVTGVARVRFVRIVKEFPYRAARVESLPQHPYPEDDPLVQLDRRALAATFERYQVTQGGDPETHVDPTVRYEILVNAVCATCDLSAQGKLELLAMDSVVERGRRIREYLEHQMRIGPARPDAPDPPTGSGERN
jgi:hypothetical protein